MTFRLLFNPERAVRLVQYHSRDNQIPGLDEVINETLKAIWIAPAARGLAGVVQRAVQMRSLEAMLSLGANPAASAETRTIVAAHMHRLRV
jgi:hypothetical protein